MVMVSSELIPSYVNLQLFFFPRHFALLSAPLKFIQRFTALSLHLLHFLCSSSHLAHIIDTLNSVIFANTVTPLLTLSHITLASPTFILLFHACFVSLKAFGQKLCQMAS